MKLPWKDLRRPFVVVWLLAVGCLTVALALLLADYDRFSWPPVIPALTTASVLLNMVAGWSHQATPHRRAYYVWRLVAAVVVTLFFLALILGHLGWAIVIAVVAGASTWIGERSSFMRRMRTPVNQD